MPPILPRFRWVQSSLTRDFSLLAALMLSGALMMAVWIGLQGVQEQRREGRELLERRLQAAEDALVARFEQTHFMLDVLGRQIRPMKPQQADALAKLLRSFDTRPETYGLFAWVDARDYLIISSNQGVIAGGGIDVSDRDYQQAAKAQPETVHMGAAILGRTSGKHVLPMAMGLLDETGRYLGTIVISLDREGLQAQLERTLTPYVAYALLDAHDGVVLQSAGAVLPKESGANKSMDAPIMMRVPVPQTSYRLMVWMESRWNMQQWAVAVSPKIAQLAVIVLALLAMMWLVRRRVVEPVLLLADAAAQMARGKPEVAIAIAQPAEIAQLAYHMQRLQEYLQERRRIEEELRRKNHLLGEAKARSEMADQSKSEFLACMSHELRTPLNAIIGFSDVMKSGCYGPIQPEKYQDYVEDIHTSGQHLLEIINDILDLAKVEAGVMQLQEAEVDLGRLMQKTSRLLVDRAHGAGVTLEITTSDTLPTLRGDALRLKQIMINLLSNALNHTPEGGEIHIAVQFLPHEAMPLIITIADTGDGMREEDIPIALSKFGQINGYTRREEGTGLGLPLSVELMRLHQGTLAIESVQGQGTTVTLAFPAARIVA
jgi:signal transduction histidine kinase